MFEVEYVHGRRKKEGWVLRATQEGSVDRCRVTSQERPPSADSSTSGHTRGPRPSLRCSHPPEPPCHSSTPSCVRPWRPVRNTGAGSRMSYKRQRSTQKSHHLVEENKDCQYSGQQACQSWSKRQDQKRKSRWSTLYDETHFGSPAFVGHSPPALSSGAPSPSSCRRVTCVWLRFHRVSWKLCRGTRQPVKKQ